MFFRLDINKFDVNLLQGIGKFFESRALCNFDVVVRDEDYIIDKLNQGYVVTYCDEHLVRSKPNEYYVSSEYLDIVKAEASESRKHATYTNFYHLVGFNGHIDLRESMEQMFPAATIEQSGNFVYPPDGGFMDWHTNREDDIKWRIYCVYATEDKRSYFRYVDTDGNVVTDYDNRGWNIRAFLCSDDLWHCVYAEDVHRVSCGYTLAGITLDDIEKYKL